jgi:hypothetical protein
MPIQKIMLSSVSEFNDFEAENLFFTELFRSKHVSISLDKYVVGVKTPQIQKDRPEGAKEILIPFEGKIKLILEEEYHEFNPQDDGISLVIIDANTKRQFENVGNVDAKVLAIFAPPFQIEEIEDFLNSVKSNS